MSKGEVKGRFINHFPTLLIFKDETFGLFPRIAKILPLFCCRCFFAGVNPKRKPFPPMTNQNGAQGNHQHGNLEDSGIVECRLKQGGFVGIGSNGHLLERPANKCFFFCCELYMKVKLKGSATFEIESWFQNFEIQAT